jgi:hypothetical protein
MVNDKWLKAGDLIMRESIHVRGRDIRRGVANRVPNADSLIDE